MNNVKLPVGISDFHKLRQNEYYYVDKTNLIKELLESRIAEVTLITRPRRFGKTVMANMITAFLGKKQDSDSIFKSLKISPLELSAANTLLDIVNAIINPITIINTRFIIFTFSIL